MNGWVVCPFLIWKHWAESLLRQNLRGLPSLRRRCWVSCRPAVWASAAASGGSSVQHWQSCHTSEGCTSISSRFLAASGWGHKQKNLLGESKVKLSFISSVIRTNEGTGPVKLTVWRSVCQSLTEFWFNFCRIHSVAIEICYFAPDVSMVLCRIIVGN